MPHQCKTVFRLFMYYKVLFLCAFCRILLWQFMLHSFHVALFPYCTISVLHFLLGNLFMVHFFSSFTLSYKLFYSCCTFTRCNIWQYFGNNGNILFCLLLPLHSSHIAIFSCCTLFMLYYFQRCSQEPPRISEIEGLALTIN